MKIYNNGYKIINKMFETCTINIEKKYKLSKFIYSKLINGKYFIFNSLTGYIFLLEISEFNSVYNKDFYSSDVEEQLFLKLLTTHTIVCVDEDENNTFLSIKKLLTSFYNINNKYLKKYTILTTTNCNAHCFYCFEHSLKKDIMDDNCAKDVVDYILKTKDNTGILLHWFGGEPLYNINAINNICGELKEKNVKFTSKITTNGFLFDDNNLQDAIDIWNLKSATITLDGMEEEHNKRKNFNKDCVDPFKRIYENIKKLTDRKVHVNIRINYDENNFDSCKELINMLYLDFSENKFVQVIPSMLYNDRNINIEKWITMDIELYNMLYKYKLSKLSLPNQILLNPCKATDESSIIITPSGKLSACEHCEPDMIFGDIYDGITIKDRYLEWTNPNFEYRYKDCYNCSFLPICHLRFGKCSIPNDKNRCKKIFENKYNLFFGILEE